jgi:hypothetical protein
MVHLPLGKYARSPPETIPAFVDRLDPNRRPATFVSPDVGATNPLLAAVAMAALPGQQGLELNGGGDVELASGHEIQGIQRVVVER